MKTYTLTYIHKISQHAYKQYMHTWKPAYMHTYMRAYTFFHQLLLPTLCAFGLGMSPRTEKQTRTAGVPERTASLAGIAPSLDALELDLHWAG